MSGVNPNAFIASSCFLAAASTSAGVSPAGSIGSTLSRHVRVGSASMLLLAPPSTRRPAGLKIAVVGSAVDGGMVILQP